MTTTDKTQLNIDLCNYFNEHEGEFKAYYCPECSHISTPGQFGLYGGLCARCGDVMDPAAKYRSGLLPVYETAIDAAKACRRDRGDLFATAAELEMLCSDPGYLAEVLTGYHGVDFIVAEYAAEAKANADKYAEHIKAANKAAACPAGFVEVAAGHVRANDWVWDKADGGFVVYNFDVPDLPVERLFLVCREVKF